MNVSGDNPWDVMQDIRWGEGHGAFWDGAIRIFEKHHAQARRDAGREAGVQASGK